MSYKEIFFGIVAIVAFMMLSSCFDNIVEEHNDAVYHYETNSYHEQIEVQREE